MKKFLMFGLIAAASMSIAHADWYEREERCDDGGGRGGYGYDGGDRYDDRYDGRGARGRYVDHGYPEYRRPMSVEARAQVQLRRLGYYYGPIDGAFGSGSRRALYRFQYDRGLPSSGWLDWRTMRALGLR